MKRKWKHGLRKAIVLLLVSSCVAAGAAGQQACLQLDKTVCRSGEVMFDILGLIVKLVSMLP